ncbi:hypothetical protein [Rhodococcus sp. 27YEA15]|uniref:hypothetical protein n=1 Tax=Rhodococcus sp. 27YEA15 TaxID=3156259 RepID=UPI003C7C117C
MPTDVEEVGGRIGQLQDTDSGGVVVRAGDRGRGNTKKTGNRFVAGLRSRFPSDVEGMTGIEPA